tara:strand:+ start:5479 stop:5709 length:231 start_codon:yes stop_codon:yes gene_type:complete
MSDYADIRNEMAYRDANEDGMYDLCEDLVSMLVLRDAEIERLRGLMNRAVNPMVTGSVPSFIKLIDDIKKEVYGDE